MALSDIGAVSSCDTISLIHFGGPWTNDHQVWGTTSEWSLLLHHVRQQGETSLMQIIEQDPRLTMVLL